MKSRNSEFTRLYNKISGLQWNGVLMENILVKLLITRSLFLNSLKWKWFLILKEMLPPLISETFKSSTGATNKIFLLVVPTLVLTVNTTSKFLLELLCSKFLVEENSSGEPSVMKVQILILSPVSTVNTLSLSLKRLRIKRFSPTLFRLPTSVTRAKWISVNMKLLKRFTLTLLILTKVALVLFIRLKNKEVNQAQWFSTLKFSILKKKARVSPSRMLVDLIIKIQKKSCSPIAVVSSSWLTRILILLIVVSWKLVSPVRIRANWSAKLPELTITYLILTVLVMIKLAVTSSQALNKPSPSKSGLLAVIKYIRILSLIP